MKNKKVLIIPPDGSRRYSGAGVLTAKYYKEYTQAGAWVDILPALGTHAPMSRAEITDFFGTEIPLERFLVHRWRDGVTCIGVVPSAYIKEILRDFIPDGELFRTASAFFSDDIPVDISDYLLDPSYDVILSIGQVVPHEVAGMANYTKNIVVGCGGAAFINASHMLGAVYGIELTQGRVDTPVRRLFDYAQAHLLKSLPIKYILNVAEAGEVVETFIGSGRDVFEQAAALSAARNITQLATPVQNCVVELGEEITSTWLGNKAIYRTRMAIANGGELLILAPGITRFGEDDENDRLIRKYGYCGRKRVLELCTQASELRTNLAVAAHLIHGSADGRFTVTYAAPRLGRELVEAAGFGYMEWDEAVARRDAAKRGDDGVFYVANPALGLWCVE
jgi:nickel-dependent lactate racemase